MLWLIYLHISWRCSFEEEFKMKLGLLASTWTTFFLLTMAYHPSCQLPSFNFAFKLFYPCEEDTRLLNTITLCRIGLVGIKPRYFAPAFWNESCWRNRTPKDLIKHIQYAWCVGEIENVVLFCYNNSLKISRHVYLSCSLIPLVHCFIGCFQGKQTKTFTCLFQPSNFCFPSRVTSPSIRDPT